MFGSLVSTFDNAYEGLYQFLDDHFKKHGKPDLLVVDFFSTAAIDWAKTNDVKYVIFYGHTFGIIAGFGDCLACPSTVYPQTAADYQSFSYRLAKVTGIISAIIHTAQTNARLNQIRRKLGVEPYDDPLTNWNGHAAIVPLSYSLEIPRRISPLVHVTGLLKEPYNVSAHQRELWPSEDVSLWKAIDNLPQPVIYLSFGSEPWFLQLSRVVEILEGIDSALKTHGGGSIVMAMRKEIQEVHGGESELKKKLPASVNVWGWVNQELILAHPSVKLFVTHGGVSSISEAIMNLVPMLVIPQFGDQPSNAMKLKDNGLALYTFDDELTRDTIKSQVLQLLTDTSFVENLVKHHKMNRFGYPSEKQAADVVELELLVGSAHLQGIDEKSPLYVNYGLDLLAFGLSLLFAIIYINVKILKLFCWVFGCCCRKPVQKTKND